ncbi:MAG: hypothetical protein M1828_000873 [Chrysothrix sp. TS-e1954]|nr:MAG: hypothetical protein M1828_000873 [Chrysothrix sp. TS-e1954]
MKGIGRICIVGGGPAGVAALKYLLAEQRFRHVVAYEQRATVGGVWNYSPETDGEVPLPVPSTDPHVPLDTPRWKDGARDPFNRSPRKIPEFQSPLYERLEGKDVDVSEIRVTSLTCKLANLPKMLMQHSDAPFGAGVQLFPEHETITSYLDRYAEDVRHLITFETQVTHIERVPYDEHSIWRVSTRNIRTNSSNVGDYDAVLITSGHYSVPFIPSIDGISHWNSRYPSVISHSKLFRKPEAFRGKKVVVVGWGPSGSDIGAQIGEYCDTLLVSVRRDADLPNLPSNALQIPEIETFLQHDEDRARAVRCKDGSILTDIDSVLFCTGYLYSYPFLSNRISPHLIGKGDRVEHVYQHIFYTQAPSLAFLTLPWNIVPFPVAEVQAATVARLWAGRLQMPNRFVIEEWERKGNEERGTGKNFHKLAPPADVSYVNELWAWCNTANREFDIDGSHKTGKVPPHWGPKEKWMRVNVPAFKAAFLRAGQGRKHIKTLSELGFHFPGDDTVDERI